MLFPMARVMVPAVVVAVPVEREMLPEVAVGGWGGGREGEEERRGGRGNEKKKKKFR